MYFINIRIYLFIYIRYEYSPAHELLSTRIFANIREFSRIFANEKKKKKKKKNIFFFFFFFLCFI